MTLPSWCSNYSTWSVNSVFDGVLSTNNTAPMDGRGSFMGIIRRTLKEKFNQFVRAAENFY